MLFETNRTTPDQQPERKATVIASKSLKYAANTS